MASSGSTCPIMAIAKLDFRCHGLRITGKCAADGNGYCVLRGWHTRGGTERRRRSRHPAIAPVAEAAPPRAWLPLGVLSSGDTKSTRRGRGPTSPMTRNEPRQSRDRSQVARQLVCRLELPRERGVTRFWEVQRRNGCRATGKRCSGLPAGWDRLQSMRRASQETAGKRGMDVATCEDRCKLKRDVPLRSKLNR